MSEKGHSNIRVDSNLVTSTTNTLYIKGCLEYEPHELFDYLMDCKPTEKEQKEIDKAIQRSKDFTSKFPD